MDNRVDLDVRSWVVITDSPPLMDMMGNTYDTPHTGVPCQIAAKSYPFILLRTIFGMPFTIDLRDKFTFINPNEEYIDEWQLASEYFSGEEGGG